MCTKVDGRGSGSLLVTTAERDGGGLRKKPHSFCKSRILLDIDRLYFLGFRELESVVVLVVALEVV
jgi:hypothetical protein